jgi:hypothetical protein
MQMGVQVRLFKGGFVFLFMLNGGKVPVFEGNRLAFPFPATTVAEKTEIKASVAGIIS